MVELLYPRLTRVRLTKNKNGRTTLSKINKSKVNPRIRMVDLLYPKLTRVRLTKNKNGRSTLSKINKSKVNQE